LATVPVGLIGLALPSAVWTVLGKPVPSALFLALNGVVLYVVEPRQRVRGNATTPASVAGGSSRPAEHSAEQTVDLSTQLTMMISIDDAGYAADRRLAQISVRDALLIGASQSLALPPGISRSGITIVAGLNRGLRHDLAARRAFPLSTPVILAAGVLEIPELFVSANREVFAPALVGSPLAGIVAYPSTDFLPLTSSGARSCRSRSTARLLVSAA
jgi:undecaprenyl-diphosphatase